MTPDPYECQPADWADPPDPETNAQLWADNAPKGWIRCPKCGDEWATEDDHQCECKDDHAET